MCSDGVLIGLGAWYTGDPAHGLVANKLGESCEGAFFDDVSRQ